MQRRFLTASKAASLYNEVSREFILPDVSWVTGFYFVNASKEVYRKGELELQAKEAELCGGANEFIAQVGVLFCERNGSRRLHLVPIANQRDWDRIEA
jgi:hypothetical protein